MGRGRPAGVPAGSRHPVRRRGWATGSPSCWWERLGGRTLGLGYAVAFADLALAPLTPSNTARAGGILFPIIRAIPALYGSSPGPTARGLGALPVGLALFALAPLLVYWIYPPTLTTSAEVPRWARAELERLGGVKRSEVVMALLVIVALALWILGGRWVSPTTAALLVFCLLLLTGTVDWDDVLGARQAWNALVWFATLVTLADGLNRVGFLGWFAAGTGSTLASLPVLAKIVGVVPAGSAPIYYASGYITRREFWRLGAIFGAIYLAVLLGLGLPYLVALPR